MTIHSTSHPEPGATKLGRVNRTDARWVAEDFYDNFTLESDGGTFAVKVGGSYVAIVGSLEGRLAILHKLPGGGRSLDVLEAMAETGATSERQFRMQLNGAR